MSEPRTREEYIEALAKAELRWLEAALAYAPHLHKRFATWEECEAWILERPDMGQRDADQMRTAWELTA